MHMHRQYLLYFINKNASCRKRIARSRMQSIWETYFFKKAYLISLPNWLRRPPLFYIFCIRPLSKEKEGGKERRGIRRCLGNMGEVTGEGSKWRKEELYRSPRISTEPLRRRSWLRYCITTYLLLRGSGLICKAAWNALWATETFDFNDQKQQQYCYKHSLLAYNNPADLMTCYIQSPEFVRSS